MKILVTGGTGFIGNHIGEVLAKRGHTLHVLVRDPEKSKTTYPATLFKWTAESDVPPAALRGVDAVLHLAGEPVAGARWTEARKKAILESRSVGTRKIVEAIKHANTQGEKIQTLVSASAIGFYGDRPDETLTEASSAGEGFLSEVCTEWERPTDDLPSSVRKTIIRIGIVLHKDGGALKELLPIFKRGLGGPVAGGKQVMSWITLTDLVQVMVRALEDTNYKGVLNATTPSHVTNREFSETLAKVLGTHAVINVPKLALKVALGEQSVIVLDSAKVMPTRLQALHFPYQFLDLKAALTHAIKGEATQA